jgi:hypothetical protein
VRRRCDAPEILTSCDRTGNGLPDNVVGVTVRVHAGGKVPAAVIALAVVLAGCGQSAAPDGAAAARSRAQVVPAARELYQTLVDTSARSVDVLDWGYKPCGTGTGTLSYGISMRLFAFTTRQNTHFAAYRHQVVSLVRPLGWTLRSRPSTRSVTLPTVPSAYYLLSRRDGKVNLTGLLSIAGDVNPLVGVSGILSVNGPCFDADGAAQRLQSHSGRPPIPASSPSPSHS